MKLVLATVLFTCKISFVHPSCAENTSPVFCDGDAFIPQIYCNDVDTDDYLCKKKNKVRCGCSAGLARSREGTCVPIQSCDITNNVRITYPLVTSTEPKGNQKGPGAKGTRNELTDIANRTLEFVKHDGEIYLTQASSELEINNECACMKSVFAAQIPSGAERTVQCYYYISATAAHGSAAQVLSSRTIFTRPHYADFVVERDKDGHIIIAVGSTELRANTCLLWTLAANALQESNQCLSALRSSCKEGVRNLTARLDECKKFDDSEKRKLKKANMEPPK